MSSISVNWQNANSIVSSYTTRRRELSSAIASLRSIKSYQCMRGSGFDTIYKAIDRMIEDLEQEKTSLNNLGNGLSEIFSTYRTYESNLSGQISSQKLTQTVYQASTDKMVSEDEDESDTSYFGWSNFWSFVSQIGILGNVIAATGKGVQGVITGDYSGKDVTSFVKNLVSAGFSIAKTSSKGAEAEWAKALLGGNNVLSKLSASAGFGSNFKTSFASQFKLVGDDVTTADKISLGSKWAGYVLEVVSEGFENADEFGIDSWNDLLTSENTGRMVLETVTESAVDIGIGAVAYAGVSAAAVGVCTALGVTVAAPAVVIGGIAVGVTWGANALCKYVTGKDIGENVSDWLFDEGGALDKASDIVSEAASAVSDAVGSAAKAVSNRLSSISSWWSKTVFA